MKTGRFAHGAQRWASALAASAVILVAFALSGCGGTTLAKGFVTILPGPVQVGTGGSLAVYAESTPASVTWTLTPGTGCTGRGCGTLASPTAMSVLYQGPASIPGASATFTLTATSTTDPTLQASQTYTIFPVAVQISGPSNATVPPLTSASFSATLPGDPTSLGVAWSLSGANCTGNGLGYQNCGTLSNSTSTSIVFTAPAAPAQETIILTATSVAFPGASATFAITVPRLNIYGFSPSTLPPAIAGEPYSATVQVTGNTPPDTFTADNLPSWATLTTTGTSFTIAGTPPAATETAAFIQININDSATPPNPASRDFTLAVYPAPATGNNLLKGSYAFYGSGWQDGNVGPGGNAFQGISYIGSFTADGQGNITGGEMDTNNFQTGLTSYATLGGTYNIQYQQDASGKPLANFQTGYITLLPPGNVRPLTLAVTFRGIQHANQNAGLATDLATAADFIEFDDTTGDGGTLTPTSSGQRMAGAVALQNSVLSQSASPFNGPFAFGMSGSTAQQTYQVNGSYSNTCYNVVPTPTCGPISLAGAFTIGSNGAVINGEEDVQVATGYNAATANSLTGSFANGGATDASGRMTASIVNSNASVTGSVLFNWPSNYIAYAVDSQHFFFMSSDSFQTFTNVIGTATYQQPQVFSTPFNTNEPVALVSSVVSTQYFTIAGQGPNGKVRAQVQVFTPTLNASGCSGGQYGLQGPQYQNLSGTSTGATVGSIGTFCNSVGPSARVQPAATSTGEAQPILYLTDTNTGYGTQWAGGSGPGLWYAMDRTSSTLNPGSYSERMVNPTSITAPLEIGIVTLPTSLPPGTSNHLAVTGTDFTQFSAPAIEYANSGAMLYTGPITGTLTNNQTFALGGVTYSGILFKGAVNLLPQNTFQACQAGFGFVISPTSFMCFDTVDQFSTPHIFQQ